MSSLNFPRKPQPMSPSEWTSKTFRKCLTKISLWLWTLISLWSGETPGLLWAMPGTSLCLQVRSPASPSQPQSANRNVIVFRRSRADSSQPRNTQRSLDAWRGNSQSPVFWDSHDFIQAGGPLGGRGSQSDARPRQQNYIHLSDEIQLFSYGCSGQSCQVSFSARGDNSQLNKTYSPAWPSGNFNRFPIFPEFFQCFQGLPNIGFHYSLKYSQSIEIFHVTNGYSVSMPEWLRLTIYPVCI